MTQTHTQVMTVRLIVSQLLYVGPQLWRSKTLPNTTYSKRHELVILDRLRKKRLSMNAPIEKYMSKLPSEWFQWYCKFNDKLMTCTVSTICNTHMHTQAVLCISDDYRVVTVYLQWSVKARLRPPPQLPVLPASSGLTRHMCVCVCGDVYVCVCVRAFFNHC